MNNKKNLYNDIKILFDKIRVKENMGRYRYLFKNIGVLTLSSFATKLLSFFLIPLYTNILTTGEYGTYDLISTTVSALLPILTLNIQEAVLRFTLDKTYDKDAIATIAVRYLIGSSFAVTFGLIINCFVGFSQVIKDYSIFFFIIYFGQVLAGIIVSYIRGTDRIIDLSISSVMASVVIICGNILLLIVFKCGLIGYFVANILGLIVQCSYLVIRSNFCKDIHLKNNYTNEKKEMTTYSKPFIANSLGWWVNNALDRYVVIYFCGLDANGIYSIASKIPNILNIFQSIFNSAWTLSAVKEFDPDDRNYFFTNTYKAYNCFMTITCSGIIVADKMLAKLLYAKDFFVAWQYVPWLTIAILFGALSGYLGGFFSAVKDSKIFARSTIIGAGCNIVLNMVLTPLMGPIGAAIATAVCHIVVWMIRFKQSKKYIKLRIKFARDVITYFVLIVQSVALLYFEGIIIYWIEFILFIFVVILYFKDIQLITQKVITKINNR